MQCFVCALFLLLLTRASGCKVGDRLYNGKCYALHSETVTFEDAEKACISHHPGGHLASFHSEEEYNFLKDLAGEISNVWIGLNKLKRCWKFSDGSRFDFHPSDKKFSDPKTEKCARIIPEGLWDMTCDKEYSYICSYTSDCEVGDTLHNGQCYALHSETVTFDEAEKACISDYPEGHLASFHSEEEYNFLKDLVGEISNVWIGLNKLNECWDFSDGSGFDFHPSDKKFSDPKTEKCARIIPEGLWDMTCDKEYSYICSYTSDCEVGDTLHNGQCYALHSETVTFEDAEKSCISHHPEGHLASFHSEEEYNFLKDLVGEISNVWIGLNKLNECWDFSDGSGFDFYPSDKKFSDPKTEKCARIIPEGLWDMTCDKEYSYICSYHATD